MRPAEHSGVRLLAWKRTAGREQAAGTRRWPVPESEAQGQPGDCAPRRGWYSHPE